jgi:hypothetical protein
MTIEKINIAIIAIAAAIGVIGIVVTVETFVAPLLQQQEAEARGCPLGSPGFNASKGRCFHP